MRVPQIETTTARYGSRRLLRLPRTEDRSDLLRAIVRWLRVIACAVAVIAGTDLIYLARHWR